MRRTVTLFLLTASAAVAPAVAAPSAFVVEKLAADQAGVAASTDADLLEAWGIAASSGSPLWIAAHGSGKAVLYNGAGLKQGLVVTIPGDGSATGVAFNGDSAAFNGDVFLFASEDGTVSGWRGALGTTAETLVTADFVNVYKGIAVGTVGGNTYAYLANFRSGAIDVVKGTGAAPALAGNFTDPNLPAGYAPFNVQALGGVLYIAYAQQDPVKHDPVPGAGHGFVDKFALNGTLLTRLITNGALDAPWGLELAPGGFSDLGGALLVGNFGDGAIHAYDSTSGAFRETLVDPNGFPLAIPGLLGLRFGNGGNGGAAGTLFFTAASGGHGLFGDLAAVALIPTLDGAGLAALFVLLSLAAWRAMAQRSR